MDGVLRDVKHSLRLMSSHQGFAWATLVTITLGVGGTASVFAVVYGVLMRPLPYPESERLVRVWEVHPGGQPLTLDAKLSGPTFRAWSQSSETLQALAAFSGRDYTITAAEIAQRVRGTRVTPALFRLLQVSPLTGRFFKDADAREGAAPVVVLSYSFWRERFGSDPAAIGNTLTIDGVEHQIIGVAPSGFGFPSKEVGLRDDRQEIRLYHAAHRPAAIRRTGRRCG